MLCVCATAGVTWISGCRCSPTRVAVVVWCLASTSQQLLAATTSPCPPQALRLSPLPPPPPPTKLFKHQQVPQRLLMGPGPANAYPRILAAQALPLLGHMHPPFLKVQSVSVCVYRAHCAVGRSPAPAACNVGIAMLRVALLLHLEVQLEVQLVLVLLAASAPRGHCGF